MVFDKNNEINDPAKPKSIAIIKMPPVLFPAIPVTFKIIPNTSITAKLVAKNKRIRIIIKFLNKKKVNTAIMENFLQNSRLNK